MKEFDLIRELTRSLPSNSTVVVGAGDDCAVLDAGVPDQFLLFKTDAVVEGVHFTLEIPPEKIGRKALARCLSDIAAMAGTPTSALITLALPASFDPQRIRRIYDGINELAARFAVAIVGGETTTNPGGILISVAMLGLVDKKNVVLRSGTRSGDALFVTGELGGSLAGKHFDFEPRLDEGRWLGERRVVHSMLDVSDGLGGDLRHLLREKNLGAELLGSAIPISRAAKLRGRSESAGKSPLLAALTDGEDFELLFTVSAKDAVPLMDGWRSQFPKLRLSCIGKITSKPGISIRDKHGARSIKVEGFEHFAAHDES